VGLFQGFRKIQIFVLERLLSMLISIHEPGQKCTFLKMLMQICKNPKNFLKKCLFSAEKAKILGGGRAAFNKKIHRGAEGGGDTNVVLLV
jgi:hypothetical protein